jgi:hypothetical protein
VKHLPQQSAKERWEPAKQLPTAAESTTSIVKDREDKEERLRMACKADREEAVAALGTEAQDKILEDTRVTRSAISINNEDERVTINSLPPSSTAPAALNGHLKQARASTVNY